MIFYPISFIDSVTPSSTWGHPFTDKVAFFREKNRGKERSIYSLPAGYWLQG